MCCPGHSFEHDIVFSQIYGMLGSIDANTGDMTLGWDTDQFCTDVGDAVRVMLPVLKQGGLGKGGLNFDAKVRLARRTYTSLAPPYATSST